MMHNGVLERKQFHVAWGKYYRTRDVEPYIRSLENQFEGSERRLAKQQGELTLLRDTIESREAEIARLNNEIAEAHAKIGEAKEEARRAVDGARDESLRLQQEKDSLADREREFERRSRGEETGLREAEARRAEAENRAEEAEKLIRELKAQLSASEEKERQAAESVRASEARLAEQMKTAAREPASQDDGKESFYREENRILREQLAQLRAAAGSGSVGDTDAEELRMNLDRANDRNRVLKSQVEQLEAELREYEALMTDQSLRDAQKRAQKIVQDALDQSSKIIDDAENIRARAFAATKAAYFNALMFRQQLAEQFSSIEQNLDNSLGILRASDMLALSPRQGVEETARTVIGTAEKKEWE